MITRLAAEGRSERVFSESLSSSAQVCAARVVGTRDQASDQLNSRKIGDRHESKGDPADHKESALLRIGYRFSLKSQRFQSSDCSSVLRPPLLTTGCCWMNASS